MCTSRQVHLVHVCAAQNLMCADPQPDRCAEEEYWLGEWSAEASLCPGARAQRVPATQVA